MALGMKPKSIPKLKIQLKKMNHINNLHIGMIYRGCMLGDIANIVDI